MSLVTICKAGPQSILQTKLLRQTHEKLSQSIISAIVNASVTSCAGKYFTEVWSRKNDFPTFVVRNISGFSFHFRVIEVEIYIGNIQ